MTDLLKAQEVARDLIQQLKQFDAVRSVRVAGSVRRWSPTVNNLNLVCTVRSKATSEDRRALFLWLREKGTLDHQSQDQISVVLNGINVDLTVCSTLTKGTVLTWATGSRDHNQALTERLRSYQMLLTKHGVFQQGRRIGGYSEREVYRLANLPYHPPEIRNGCLFEDLPRLVRKDDVKVVLAKPPRDVDPVEQIKNALEQGIKTLIFSDRIEDLRSGLPAYLKKVEALQRQYLSHIRILPAVTADVDQEGEIHVPDLPEIALVVARPKRKGQWLTTLSKAIKKDRRIGIVSGYESTKVGPWGRLFRTAATLGVTLEIGGDPSRYLPVELLRRAREKGCKFLVGDSPFNLHWARKGFVTPESLGFP